MPGALDSAMKSVGQKLLNSLGSSGTIVRQTTSFDPITNTESSTPAEYACLASPPSPFKQALVDGSRILQTDLSVLISSLKADGSALEIEPDPDTDTYRLPSGAEYKIVTVFPISGGLTNAAYRLQLRK